MSFDLDVGNAQLHGHVEAVQEVATKHQWIHRCIHGMNPSCTHSKRCTAETSSRLTHARQHYYQLVWPFCPVWLCAVMNLVLSVSQHKRKLSHILTFLIIAPYKYSYLLTYIVLYHTTNTLSTIQRFLISETKWSHCFFSQHDRYLAALKFLTYSN